jgi:hypothetical protein
MELICCVCGKLKRQDAWVRAQPREGEPLSHGYCLECAEAFLRELRSTPRSPDSPDRAVA